MNSHVRSHAASYCTGAARPEPQRFHGCPVPRHRCWLALARALAAVLVLTPQMISAQEINLADVGDRGIQLVRPAGTRDVIWSSVSGAGDFNGDGFADLIVGAPFADANGEDAGTSFVVFGASNIASADDRARLQTRDCVELRSIQATPSALLAMAATTIRVMLGCGSVTAMPQPMHRGSPNRWLPCTGRPRLPCYQTGTFPRTWHGPWTLACHLPPKSPRLLPRSLCATPTPTSQGWTRAPFRSMRRPTSMTSS